MKYQGIWSEFSVGAQMWIGNLPYELLIPVFGYFIPDTYAFGTFPVHASSGSLRVGISDTVFTGMIIKG